MEGEAKDGMLLDFAELAAVVPFPFTLRVYEGHAKWAETERGRTA